MVDESYEHWLDPTLGKSARTQPALPCPNRPYPEPIQSSGAKNPLEDTRLEGGQAIGDATRDLIQAQLGVHVFTTFAPDRGELVRVLKGPAHRPSHLGRLHSGPAVALIELGDRVGQSAIDRDQFVLGMDQHAVVLVHELGTSTPVD